MVPALMRLRRGRPPRWSITADIPQRSSLGRSRRICPRLIPRISLAGTQLSCLAIALVITARRVIAPASRPTRRSMSCIERLYRTRRTSLNVYAPDISNVYDSREHAVIMNAGNRARVAAVSEPARKSIDARLVDELRGMLGEDGIVSRATELKVYECDGWTVEKSMPDVVVRPRNTAEVSAVLKLLYQRGVAFVPRGAGTGLSGGCPPPRPVMICTSRMNRIVAIDLANRRVEVESGGVNLHVTNAVKADGFFYAPDPSSQTACTIGGNIAENSGGPHTLKYGVTTNHV